MNLSPIYTEKRVIMSYHFFQGVPYIAEIITVCVIAIFMAVSPGPDFVMVTRNSLLHSRRAGIFSALGIGLAIWVHVTYSIAGLAVIISKSIILFSFLKYLGAAYLIYTGWKTFRSKSGLDMDESTATQGIGAFASFKIGFMTNVLNPKTSIFFLSIFTQIVDPQTPLVLQLVYGAIISVVHLIWFCIVAVFFTHPVLLRKFTASRKAIERVVGTLLIGLGVKIATTQ